MPTVHQDPSGASQPSCKQGAALLVAVMEERTLLDVEANHEASLDEAAMSHGSRHGIGHGKPVCEPVMGPTRGLLGTLAKAISE